MTYIEETADLFKPINPTLYNALKSRFGKVVIANQGGRMNAVRCESRFRPGRTRMHFLSAGEYYRIACPFCQDSRFRLWINYMYGQRNEQTGYPETWLAICYNENCVESPARRRELERLIFGFRNRHERNQRMPLQDVGTESTILAPDTMPGLCLSLTNLPPDHPANLYLIDRRHNPAQLVEQYGISYCVDAEPAFRMAQNRIIIPIYMDAKLVGWQARYVGDMTKEQWKAAQLPKYYFRRGMPKRLMLYNFDNAKLWPFVVVVEGVPSVWRIGGPAVALLGKTLSPQQQQLLRTTWQGKPIILILDPDARDEMEGILTEFIRLQQNPVVPIYLPAGFDPDNYEHEAIVNIICAYASQAGIHLDPW